MTVELMELCLSFACCGNASCREDLCMSKSLFAVCNLMVAGITSFCDLFFFFLLHADKVGDVILVLVAITMSISENISR